MELKYKLDRQSWQQLKADSANVDAKLSELNGTLLVFENSSEIAIDMPDKSVPGDIFLAGLIIGRLIGE